MHACPRVPQSLAVWRRASMTKCYWSLVSSAPKLSAVYLMALQFVRWVIVSPAEARELSEWLDRHLHMMDGLSPNELLLSTRSLILMIEQMQLPRQTEELALEPMKVMQELFHFAMTRFRSLSPSTFLSASKHEGPALGKKCVQQQVSLLELASACVLQTPPPFFQAQVAVVLGCARPLLWLESTVETALRCVSRILHGHYQGRQSYWTVGDDGSLPRYGSKSRCAHELKVLQHETPTRYGGGLFPGENLHSWYCRAGYIQSIIFPDAWDLLRGMHGYRSAALAARKFARRALGGPKELPHAARLVDSITEIVVCLAAPNLHWAVYKMIMPWLRTGRYMSPPYMCAAIRALKIMLDEKSEFHVILKRTEESRRLAILAQLASSLDELMRKANSQVGVERLHVRFFPLSMRNLEELPLSGWEDVDAVSEGEFGFRLPDCRDGIDTSSWAVEHLLPATPRRKSSTPLELEIYRRPQGPSGGRSSEAVSLSYSRCHSIMHDDAPMLLSLDLFSIWTMQTNEAPRQMRLLPETRLAFAKYAAALENNSTDGPASSKWLMLFIEALELLPHFDTNTIPGNVIVDKQGRCFLVKALAHPDERVARAAGLALQRLFDKHAELRVPLFKALLSLLGRIPVTDVAVQATAIGQLAQLIEIWTIKVDRIDAKSMTTTNVPEPREPYLAKIEAEALISMASASSAVRLSGLRLLEATNLFGHAMVSMHSRITNQLGREAEHRDEVATPRSHRSLAKRGSRNGCAGEVIASSGGSIARSPLCTARSTSSATDSDSAEMQELRLVRKLIKADAPKPTSKATLAPRLAAVLCYHWEEVQEQAMHRLLTVAGDAVLETSAYAWPSEFSLKDLARDEHSILWSHVLVAGVHVALDTGCIGMATMTRRALRRRMDRLPKLSAIHAESVDGLLIALHINWGSLLMACSGTPFGDTMPVGGVAKMMDVVNHLNAGSYAEGAGGNRGGPRSRQVPPKKTSRQRRLEKHQRKLGIFLNNEDWWEVDSDEEASPQLSMVRQLGRWVGVYLCHFDSPSYWVRQIVQLNLSAAHATTLPVVLARLLLQTQPGGTARSSRCKIGPASQVPSLVPLHAQQHPQQVTRLIRLLSQSHGLPKMLNSCVGLSALLVRCMHEGAETLLAPATRLVHQGRPSTALLSTLDPNEHLEWAIDYLAMVAGIADAICRARKLQGHAEYEDLVPGIDESTWPIQRRCELYGKLKCWSGHGRDGARVLAAEQKEIELELRHKHEISQKDMVRRCKLGARRRLRYVHWACAQLLCVGPLLPMKNVDVEEELSWATDGEMVAPFTLLSPLLAFHFDSVFPHFLLRTHALASPASGLFQAAIFKPMRASGRSSLAVHHARMSKAVLLSIDRAARGSEAAKRLLVSHHANIGAMLIWAIMFLVSPECSFRLDAVATLYDLLEEFSEPTTIEDVEDHPSSAGGPHAWPTRAEAEEFMAAHIEGLPDIFWRQLSHVLPLSESTTEADVKARASISDLLNAAATSGRTRSASQLLGFVEEMSQMMSQRLSQFSAAVICEVCDPPVALSSCLYAVTSGV